MSLAKVKPIVDGDTLGPRQLLKLIQLYHRLSLSMSESIKYKAAKQMDKNDLRRLKRSIQFYRIVMRNTV